MKRLLQISRVLSWFNIVFWSFLILLFLLGILVTGNLPMLIAVFFLTAVILHNYAALQLYKSLWYTNIPLAPRTASGLRFIGFGAMMVGIVISIQCVTILQNIPELVKASQSQMPPQTLEQLKQFDVARIYRIIFGFILISGIAVTANVVVNLRLLRWYYVLQQEEQKKKQQDPDLN
jgi:hypothetical protein